MPGLYLGYFLQDLHIRRQPNHIPAGARVEETFPKYEMLSTHAGRRTFICLALSSGIPPQVVMKWTGHCDYKSMRPYIDITESAKKDTIKKMEDAFKKK